MKISVERSAGVAPALDNAAVRRVVKAALAAEGLRAADPWEVAVRFAGADELRAVNRDLRGIDRATDVISFSAAEGEGGEYAGLLLGDLLIAPEVVAAHAKRYRTTAARETAFVLIHGVLHLLGYDHDTPARRRRMRERQNAILEAVAP